jgi:hypothetical protein
MYRVSINKKTGKLIEMQSGGRSENKELEAARLETLRQNAVSAGYKDKEIDVRWVNEEEWQALVLANQPPIPIATQINKIRAEIISQGIPYTFPDGIPGTVQMRDWKDHANLNTFGNQVLLLLQLGKTAELEYKDAEDVRHKMTPTEASKFYLDVSCKGTAIMSASWDKKDEIKALETPAELEAYLEENPIEEGWPE